MKNTPVFLPTTPDEAHRLGWDTMDVILVTGDAYIDSPLIGVSVIGKVLIDAGYRVGIIAQPDLNTDQDIKRLGEPRLFWGITAGCIDSMVANYTPLKKKRRSDDYTPGGKNERRPDRATIAYTNLIRRYRRNSRPIILGGIEASLRRIAHYDFWDNKVRRSILFDSKADMIVYGMGEKTVCELADCLNRGDDATRIRGLCYISKNKIDGYTALPSFEEASSSKKAFTEMFSTFYSNNDPIKGKGLYQGHGDRYLVQTPPQNIPGIKEIDRIYDLDYARDVHPYYKTRGKVKAIETIQFSISTHRGCLGECNFCSIAVHEGRIVVSRSTASILREAGIIAGHPEFKGYIQDLGGPTANMYAIQCKKMIKQGPCRDRRCIFPKVCSGLNVDHSSLLNLLKEIRKIRGVKKVFVASGIRYDLVLADKAFGMAYLEEIVKHHVSGQMKIAPEHTEEKVLKKMGKPGPGMLTEFREKFYALTKSFDKRQFLTYYLIAAHPGCTENDMRRCRDFTRKRLNTIPEQVQIFTPTPCTYSTLMYYTGYDPFNEEPLFVEKDVLKKQRQKNLITGNAKAVK